MTAEVFYWVLNISVIGSLSGLALLILRKIRRFPRFAVYLLWAVPLIRFWIPFGIANQYSLLNFISKFTTRTVPLTGKTPGMPELTVTNSIMAANSYFPIEYKTNTLEAVFKIAAAVWVIVAAASVIAAVLLYIFTKTELKSAELIKGNIYKSDKINSPAIYGILSPRIIIPATLAESDIEYILMHETVHIKRRDNLWRVAAVITACVHWFNPLIWIFIKCFFTDMELACDEGVIKKLDRERTGEYAKALVSASSGRAFFASAFGGARVRLRVENILSYKRLTLFSSLSFGILAAAIAVVLLTNATG